MNDAALSENFEEWPNDPFALFGVTRAVSLRDLRRIYTRLIRIYKPERSPEQFRRIREAYENLRQYAAWNEANAESQDPDNELQVPDASPSNEESVNELTTEKASSNTNEANAESQNADNELQIPDARPAYEESVNEKITEKANTQEQCWGWAVGGDIERAYEVLLELRTRQPENPRLYLRLYWLLTAKPRLDATRTPCDWLAIGLRSCPQYARLLVAYSEEIEDVPEEGVSRRFTELLQAVRGPLLLELFERRWRAIAALEWWYVAADDLAKYGECVCRDDEVAWLRLLLSLCAKSFHQKSDQRQDVSSVFRMCRNKIKALDHLALDNGALFDRAEALNLLACESKWSVPRTILDVVVHFAAEQTDQAFVSIEPFLAIVRDRPVEGLHLLDETAFKTPNIMQEFGRALSWFSCVAGRSENRIHAAEAADKLVYSLLTSRLKSASYRKARQHILQYCCREAISPEQICEVLKTPTYGPNFLVQRIQADLPLRWTFWAYKLSWAPG